MLRVPVVCFATFLILTTAGTAWADNVTNDVTVGGSDTIAVGATTTVKYKIVGSGGDGQAGCNASDGSSAVVTILHPVQVTVTPATLTFTACNNQQSVVFTSSTPGDYGISVTVADGGVGTYNAGPAGFTLHVRDVVPPETTITAGPSDPSGSDAASFSFTGSDDVTAPGSLAFECDLDGGGFTACTSPAAYSGLGEGSHTFRVRTRDGVGNVDPTPATITWTIDRSAPETTITAGPSDPSGSDAASFSFTGSDDVTAPGSLAFECDLDGGGFTACTSPAAYSGLGEGSHTFQVRARDGVGNVDPTPATITWTIDLPDPALVLSCDAGSLSITAGDGASRSCSVGSVDGFSSAVDLACSGLPAGVTCSFSPNPVTPPPDGSVVSVLSLEVGATVPAGPYAFEVVGSGGGMVRSVPSSFTVLPRAVLHLSEDALTPGGDLNVDGAGFAPGAEITVTLHSTPVLLAVTTADALGRFSVSVTIPRTTSPGVHTIKATGLDPEGTTRVLGLRIIVSGQVSTLAETGSPLLPWTIVGLGAITFGGACRRRARKVGRPLSRAGRGELTA